MSISFTPLISCIIKFLFMNKALLLLSLLLVVLSQPILNHPEDIAFTNEPKLVGGFSQVDPNSNDIGEDQLQVQKTVDSFARKHYQNLNNGEELGTLVKMQRQIVAGMNFKLHYKRSNGEVVVVTVYRNLEGTLLVSSVEQKVDKN